ncbi:MAG: AAA family ATPase [Bryobacteraceae bacterium]
MQDNLGSDILPISMNLLSSAQIKGLWDRNIRLDFHSDVNLLIGVNGSGKTTIVSLLAAVLRADVSALNRTHFQSIALDLASSKGRNTARLEIEKITDEQSPFTRYVFKIKKAGVRKKQVYILHEERVYSPRYRLSEVRRQSEGLAEELALLVNITWLSVHRSQQSISREEQYESLVDKKLNQVSNNLVRYFSLLSTRGTNQTEHFQKAVFQSLLHHPTESNAFAIVKGLDLAAEERALTQIFREFGVCDESTIEAIDKQFKLVRQFVERGGVRAFTWDQLVATVGMLRNHSIVQEWHRLIEQLQAIYAPRDQFLRMLSSLMPKKTFIINNKNELAATIGARTLPLRSLSSGEKQLLIILGEALLQDKAPCIYIADEPELSLHVTWQEQLIANLRRVNPNAQILFATHSPDIVGQYSKNIMDMERILG